MQLSTKHWGKSVASAQTVEHSFPGSIVPSFSKHVKTHWFDVSDPHSCEQDLTLASANFFAGSIAISITGATNSAKIPKSPIRHKVITNILSLLFFFISHYLQL
jgi:hypothetical protein